MISYYLDYFVNWPLKWIPTFVTYKPTCQANAYNTDLDIKLPEYMSSCNFSGLCTLKYAEIKQNLTNKYIYHLWQSLIV